MRHSVSPYVDNVIEEIKSEIHRTSDCTDETSRDIAREYMKMHALSYLEMESVKQALAEDIGLIGI